MNGAIQNWGLVEFTSPEETEETRNLLNGFKLQGQPIRVSYYVPGVRAINIYMKLLNDPVSLVFNGFSFIIIHSTLKQNYKIDFLIFLLFEVTVFAFIA